LKPDPRRAAVFAPKLDRLLTHLTTGGSGMTTDLPVPPAFLRTHDRGSSTLRGLLRRLNARTHRRCRAPQCWTAARC
jgi:hypothetical protein